MKVQISKYPEYKKTESAWTPLIPKTWKMGSLKWLSKRFSGGTPDKTKPHYWDDNDIPWLNSGAVNQDIIKEPSDYISKEGFANSSAKWIQKESVLVALAGQGKTKGTAAFCEIETTCNQSLAAVTFREELHPKYFYWFLKSKYRNIRGLASSDGRDGLNLEMLGSIKLPIPSHSEQTLIARFLDQKTSQIDRLIGQKEKLLKLLAEKRTAIITQAVTKGLDADVEMKDSGIGWLGEIPKHWIPKRLKYLTDKIIDGTHSTPEYLSEGVPFLRVTDIVKSQGEKLDSDNFKYISEEEHQELTKRCNPEKGDLLYSKNGTIGIPRVIDWDFDFSIFVSLCLVKIKIDLLIPSFLSYSLQSKLTENQISIGSKKSAVINLHLDKIKEFVIPYPPMDEQIKINEWLNKQLPKFNKSEKKLIESIDKLKEYREALITAAVTGQIDIREEVENV